MNTYGLINTKILTSYCYNSRDLIASNSMNTIKISEKTKDRGMEVLAVSENVDHMTTTPVALIPGVSDAKSFIAKHKSWGSSPFTSQN